jgi:opacity protein-like surface antigen
LDVFTEAAGVFRKGQRACAGDELEAVAAEQARHLLIALRIGEHQRAVHTGWTVGGGVEVKLTRRISLGLEFMHTDLGRGNDINGSAAAGFVPATPEGYGVGLRSDSITARFNYLFGQ